MEVNQLAAQEPSQAQLIAMTPHELDSYIRERDDQWALNMRKGRAKLQRNRALYPRMVEVRREAMAGNTGVAIVDDEGIDISGWKADDVEKWSKKFANQWFTEPGFHGNEIVFTDEPISSVER